MLLRKKGVSVFMVLVAVLLITVGCGGGNQTDSSTSKEKKFTNSNWAELNTDPDKFKNAVVDVTGKVFTAPEKDEDGTYFQMWADPKNNEFNTMVAVNDPGLEVVQGDYVCVTGTVKGAYTGENMVGGKITAPVIIANKAEKTDPKEILAPTKLTVDVNKSSDQHGLVILLNKIELADEETRLYVTLKNYSQQKASFYSFNAKSTQGTNQFEEQSNYEADYPEVSSEILPGVESSGVVVLQPLDATAKSAKFFLEGRTENYSLNFQPYVFDVTW